MVVIAALYALAALPVTFFFVTHPGLTGHPRADFGDMIDGTASRPYVTRALVPFVVRSITAVTPAPAREAVEAGLRGRRMVEIFGWEDGRLFEYATASLVFVGCFVGFGLALRRLVAALYGFSRGFRDLSPLVAYAVLPLFFRYYSYPYDPATLLLFSWGVAAIVAERPREFLFALMLAALNKETSLLLVALYGLHRHLRGSRGVWAQTGAFLLVWAAIRFVLGLAFRDRPGAVVETHLDHSLWLFTEFPGRLFYALAVAGLLAAAVAPGWRDKPRFLRLGLMVTLLPLLGAGLLFGYADELRGYYEAFPFVFLLALPTIEREPGPAGDP